MHLFLGLTKNIAQETHTAELETNSLKAKDSLRAVSLLPKSTAIQEQILSPKATIEKSKHF